MSIRAKFRVHSVQPYQGGEQVSLSPVYSSDPSSANYSWSQATPGGQLTMLISNPDACGLLELNKEYFIDFTPAE
ncbi:hypothetical protein DyAD56_15945 [Dyella sp. AD56]|uniref:hypothetical protein n=1 Tax=Dyella sp. AD56 TaxID=1528744 RepID=UPI000C8464F5|nr:hypothetical protein [Dyella sp. AD56]PMQ04180.1 hypothetical protein DyAD56_15945 [Dyella sp. AD56]